MGERSNDNSNNTIDNNSCFNNSSYYKYLQDSKPTQTNGNSQRYRRTELQRLRLTYYRAVKTI